MSEIKNKVKTSNLLVIDLQSCLPSHSVYDLDLKDFLYQGIVLKEKSFREKIKNLDTNAYKNQIVAVFCSADAIIPHWAYMLIMEKLNNIAKDVFYGTIEEVEKTLLNDSINNFNIEEYTDKKVMLKGCGNIKYPELTFTSMTKRLLPFVKSLMYGEPCGAVPIYKKK